VIDKREPFASKKNGCDSQANLHLNPVINNRESFASKQNGHDSMTNLHFNSMINKRESPFALKVIHSLETYVEVVWMTLVQYVSQKPQKHTLHEINHPEGNVEIL
jgi:hypothetical protein